MLDPFDAAGVARTRENVSSYCCALYASEADEVEALDDVPGLDENYESLCFLLFNPKRRRAIPGRRR